MVLAIGTIGEESFCEEPKAISRVRNSVEYFEAVKAAEKYMQDAGMQTKVDSIGNLHGYLQGEDPQSKTIAIGSHHKKYAGFAPDDVQHKDILIDSSLLGVEETANYLTMIIRKKFNL